MTITKEKKVLWLQTIDAMGAMMEAGQIVAERDPSTLMDGIKATSESKTLQNIIPGSDEVNDALEDPGAIVVVGEYYRQMAEILSDLRTFIESLPTED